MKFTLSRLLKHFRWTSLNLESLHLIESDQIHPSKHRLKPSNHSQDHEDATAMLHSFHLIK